MLGQDVINANVFAGVDVPLNSPQGQTAQCNQTEDQYNLRLYRSQVAYQHHQKKSGLNEVWLIWKGCQEKEQGSTVSVFTIASEQTTRLLEQSLEKAVKHGGGGVTIQAAFVATGPEHVAVIDLTMNSPVQ